MNKKDKDKLKRLSAKAEKVHNDICSHLDNTQGLGEMGISMLIEDDRVCLADRVDGVVIAVVSFPVSEAERILNGFQEGVAAYLKNGVKPPKILH